MDNIVSELHLTCYLIVKYKDLNLVKNQPRGLIRLKYPLKMIRIFFVLWLKIKLSTKKSPFFNKWAFLIINLVPESQLMQWYTQCHQLELL